MTNEQKIIKNKLGLLKLAEQLGNVSQACKVMGFSRGVHLGDLCDDIFPHRVDYRYRWLGFSLWAAYQRCEWLVFHRISFSLTRKD